MSAPQPTPALAEDVFDDAPTAQRPIAFARLAQACDEQAKQPPAGACSEKGES